MWYLYVLELEHGCYYVGIALDIKKRFEQHAAGLGAMFTQTHKPIRVAESQCCNTDNKDAAYKMENEKTLEYAIRYGGDKVKGGKYFIPSKLIRKVSMQKTTPTTYNE